MLLCMQVPAKSSSPNPSPSRSDVSSPSGAHQPSVFEFDASVLRNSHKLHSLERERSRDTSQSSTKPLLCRNQTSQGVRALHSAPSRRCRPSGVLTPKQPSKKRSRSMSLATHGNGIDSNHAADVLRLHADDHRLCQSSHSKRRRANEYLSLSEPHKLPQSSKLASDEHCRNSPALNSPSSSSPVKSLPCSEVVAQSKPVKSAQLAPQSTKRAPKRSRASALRVHVDSKFSLPISSVHVSPQGAGPAEGALQDYCSPAKVARTPSQQSPSHRRVIGDVDNDNLDSSHSTTQPDDNRTTIHEEKTSSPSAFDSQAKQQQPISCTPPDVESEASTSSSDDAQPRKDGKNEASVSSLGE